MRDWTRWAAGWVAGGPKPVHSHDLPDVLITGKLSIWAFDLNDLSEIVNLK